MKKFIIALLLAFVSVGGYAQLKLSGKDFDHLVAISRIYSHNTMCNADGFAKSVDSLRTPLLDHVVDGLIEIGKADTMIVANKFMARPANDELQLWYAINQVDYDFADTTKKTWFPDKVAQKALAEHVDERILLDNYYYMLSSGVAMMFNTADLSKHNFNLDSLGFKNDTEKGIFFLRMMDQLAYGRFLVLHSMKKGDKLLAFANKLPMFNGRLYFYYTKFDFPDFDFPKGDKTKSYKTDRINLFMNTLILEFMTYSEISDRIHAREMYFNSILYKPEYFSFCEQKDGLQEIYNKSK